MTSYATELDALSRATRQKLVEASGAKHREREMQALWLAHLDAFRRHFDPEDPFDWIDASKAEQRAFISVFDALCEGASLDPRSTLLACERRRAGLGAVTNADLADVEGADVLRETAAALARGESMEIPEVGTFTTRVRKARRGTTGDGRAFEVAERRVLGFRAAPPFRAHLNGEGELRTPLAKALAARLELGARYLTLDGIGELVLRLREARMGRNPRTGEPLEIPATLTVSFFAHRTAVEAPARE